MKKRLAACILALTLLASASFPAAASGNTPKIYTAAASGVPGGVAELTVSISDSPGIAAFIIYIECDTGAFSVDYMESDGSYAVTPGKLSSGGTLLANSYEDRGWQVGWFNTTDRVGSGSLFTLPLRVSETAKPGTYPVTLRISAENTINAAGKPVSVAAEGGSVIISDGTQTDAPPVFSDVPQEHWAAEYIYLLAERGIVNGFGDGTFAPDNMVTRAELVKMLAVLAKAEFSGNADARFTDVSPGDWYEPYVTWGARNGYVNGFPDGSFAPNELITREQLAAVLYRFASDRGLALPASNSAAAFADSADISGYATEAVSAMQRAGMINGYPDSTFRPQGNAARAEAAKLLATLLRSIA